MQHNTHTLTLYERALDHVMKTYKRIEYRRPSYDEVDDGTVIGGSTWSKRGGTRWIVNALHLVRPDLPVTHQDLARQWLRETYKLPLRRKKEDQPVDWAPLPLLAKRGVWRGGWAYVDIKSAYRHILSTVGWDVEYRASRWLAAGDTRVSDELTKLAYSSAVAIASRYYSTLRIVRRGSIETRRQRNIYANVCIYALARDLLYYVYSDVMRSGATVVYYNTDGCVVRWRDAERVVNTIREWGMDVRIKAVSPIAMVWGTGSFAIGEMATRRISRHAAPPPEPADCSDVAWLRQRYSAFAQRAA